MDGPNDVWEEFPVPGSRSSTSANDLDEGVFIPAPGAAEREKRERESAEREETRLGISLAEKAAQEAEREKSTFFDLRDRYLKDPAVTKYEGSIPYYTAALTTAPNEDLTLLYLYAKTVDPNSTVGASDMENINASDARLPGAVQTALRELRASDGKFTDQARDSIRSGLHRVIAQHNLAYHTARERSSADAIYFGIDPKRIVGDHFGRKFNNEIKNYWEKIYTSDTSKIPEEYRKDIEKKEPIASEMVAGGEYSIATPGAQFQTEADLLVQRQLGDAWNRGLPVDEIIQFNAQLGRGSFSSEDIQRMRDARAKGEPMEFYAPPSGRNPREMGFLEGLKESVTGAERSTPEIEALPEWVTMPELNELSIAGAKTGMGTMFTSPEESVQIIRANYPSVQVRQDAKGNYILRSSIDGREYGIQPGFRWGDVPRAIGGILAFTPAGRAATLPGAVGGAALTQAGIEATQTAAGGEFNPSEIAMAGAGGAAGKVIEKAIPLALQGLRRTTRGPEVPPVGGAVPEVPPAPPAGAAAPEVPPVAPSPAPPAASPTPIRAPSVAEQQGITEEMVSLARQAAGRGRQGRAARGKLRAAVEADPMLAQQAEAIGLELPADVFSANVQLKNLTGLARSQPGSAAEAGWQQTISNSARQIEEDITALGATDDLASLSDDILSRLSNSEESLMNQGGALRDSIPELQSRELKSSLVEADDLRAYLQDEIDLNGGFDKSPPEIQKLAREFGVGGKDTSARPTYHRMDRLRDELGKAKRGQGPWADMNDVLRNELYNMIADARVSHVRKVIGDEAADTLAASNQVFSAGYAVRDQLADLFGRDLNKGIGAQIRSVIAQGARGDTTNLKKMLRAIPENQRSEVVMSGILANARTRTRGGDGDFSFANFRNTYKALRRNEPVYRELARNMTKPQRDFLDNLYGVSQGIADAQSRIISTGLARGGPAAEINAQSLTQKIVEQATRRGVGAGTAMLGGALLDEVALGIPAAVALETSLAYLSRKGASNLDRVSDVIGSAPFRDLVNEAAQGETTIRAINRLANSKPFGLFARGLGLDSQDARRAWIKSALTAGIVATPEQREPTQSTPPVGAIMVGPQ